MADPTTDSTTADLYTPTTDEVRRRWGPSDRPSSSHEERSAADAAFYRWLDARDAELLRRAANRVGDLQLPASEVEELIETDEATEEWCRGWDAAVQQGEIAVLLPRQRRATS